MGPHEYASQRISGRLLSIEPTCSLTDDTKQNHVHSWIPWESPTTGSDHKRLESLEKLHLESWSRQAQHWLYTWDSDWESKAQSRDGFRGRFQSWLRFCRRKWRGPAMVQVKSTSREKVVKPSVKSEYDRIQKLEELR